MSLSKEEATVYKIVLRNGPITVGEVALYVKKPYEEVRSILRTLRERELIVQLPGIVERYIVTPPYKAFTEYLGEVKSTVEEELAVSKKNLEKYLTKTEKTINKISKGVSKSLDESIETLKSGLTSTRTIIEKFGNKSLKELDKKLKDLSVSSAELFENLRSEEENILTAIRENFRNLINKTSKSSVSILHDWKNQISTMLSEEVKVFEKNINELKAQSLSTLNGTVSDIEADLSNISSEFLNTLTAVTDEVSKTSGQISEVISTSYKNALTLFETSTSEIQSKATEILSESLDLQREKILNLSNFLNKSASDLSLFFNNSVSEIRNSIEYNLNTWWEEEEKQLSDLLEKNRNLMASSKTIATESLDKASSEIVNKLSSLKNAVSELLKDINLNVNNYLQKDLERVKEEISSAREETNQLLLENLSDYEKILTTLEKNTISVLNTSITALMETQSIVEEGIQSKLTSTLENYQLTVRDLLESTTKAVRTIKEAVESEISSLKAKFQSELNVHVEKFAEEMNTLKKEVEKIVSSSLSKLKEHTDTAKKTVRETISTALNDIKMIVETLEKKLTSTEKHFSEAIEAEAGRVVESINSVRTASEEKIAEYEQLLRTVASQVEQSALTTIHSCFQEFSKGLEAAGSNITTNLEINLNTLNQVINAVRDDISGALAGWKTSTSQEAKKLEKTVKRTISQVVEEYRIKSERVRGDLQKKLQQLLEDREIEVKDLSEKLQSYTLDVETKLEKILSADAIQPLIEEGKRTIEETISSHMQKTEDIFDHIEKIKRITSEIIEDTRRKLDGTLQKTENYTVNLAKETQETISNLLDALTKATNEAEEKLPSTMLEHLTGFKETWIDSQKSILTQLQSGNEKLINRLAETKEKITEILNTSSKTLITSIDTLKESMPAVFDDQLQKFETSISNFKNLLEGSVKEREQKQAEASANIEKALEEAITTVEQDRYNLFEKLDESRATLVSGVSALATNFVNDVVDHTFQSLLAYVNKHASKTVNLRKKIEEDLAEIPKEFKIIVEKLNIEGIIGEIIGKTAETKEILTGIWEEIRKIKPLEIERIWYIAGKDAIFTYIKDVITRTEKSLTLVLPSFNEISLFEDQIKELKPPKRIYIITDVKIAEDAAKIRELLKLKNIRLRSRSQRDCYGVIRDRKEMLIAPISEKEEVVALVTDKPEYVKLFQNLIGGTWIKQSKSIGVKDLRKTGKTRK